MTTDRRRSRPKLPEGPPSKAHVPLSFELRFPETTRGHVMAIRDDAFGGLGSNTAVVRAVLALAADPEWEHHNTFVNALQDRNRKGASAERQEQ